MLHLVEKLARDAAQIALQYRGQKFEFRDQQLWYRSLLPKPTVEQQVEVFLSEKLIAAFPGYGIKGEHGAAIARSTGSGVWEIKAIDGSRNFQRGSPDWAISIGLLDENEVPKLGVIFAPDHNLMLSGGDDCEVKVNDATLSRTQPLDMANGCPAIELHPSIGKDEHETVLRFFLEKCPLGFRCYGSSSIALMSLALGYVDNYLSLSSYISGHASGLAILRKLGYLYRIDAKTNENGSVTFRSLCGNGRYLESCDQLFTDLFIVSY